MFGVISDERLLVEGGCQRQDDGCVTWVGPADEGVTGDEGILWFREDKPKVAILAPAAGTLDWRRVGGEETVSVSNRFVGRFSCLRGEFWGREAAGDGVDQLGMRNL